jgi:outer membrane protein TolC
MDSREKGNSMRFKVFVCGFFSLLILTICTAQEESISLADAIERALKYNYDIRIGRLDEKAASVQNSWGGAGALPTLDFSLSGTRTQELETSDDGIQDRISGSLSLQWILFDGFAVHIRKSQLKHLEKLSQGNTALLIEQTVQSVILAYYDVLLQHEKLHVLDTLRILSNDRYEKAKIKKELGALVTYDLLQAKNAWLEDQSRFLEQSNTIRNAMRNLNYLMGESGDRIYTLTEVFKADWEPYELTNLIDKMKADNRMLRNKYVQQVLLEKEVALKRSDWWPSLTLSAGLDGSYLDAGSASSVSESRDGYATLNLRWNLFTGGTRRRAVAIAKIDRETGQVEIDAMIHSLSNQLTSELELYNVRKQLLDVATEAQATSALNLQISEEKFRAGAINSFNYRDVQMIYLNAAVNRLEAVYRLIEAETELMRLTGGILGIYQKKD